MSITNIIHLNYILYWNPWHFASIFSPTCVSDAMAVFDPKPFSTSSHKMAFNRESFSWNGQCLTASHGNEHFKRIATSTTIGIWTFNLSICLVAFCSSYLVNLKKRKKKTNTKIKKTNAFQCIMFVCSFVKLVFSKLLWQRLNFPMIVTIYNVATFVLFSFLLSFLKMNWSRL